MKKNYIGICLDKSGSMQGIRRATVKAYNQNIKGIREATEQEGQDTILYSNAFGGIVSWLFRNSSVNRLSDLNENDYRPDGGTPLFRALVEMIEELKRVPDYNDPNVAFQVLVITDGEENTSGFGVIEQAKRLMKELVATDRWTFAFALPRGYKYNFCRSYGVQEGNVDEWEATERGVMESFTRTTQAYRSYLGERTKGMTASKTFYSDLTGVSSQTVKAQLVDISNDVKVWNTDRDNELIREFCERKSGKNFLKGAAFYQLTKTEKKVQDYKQLVIEDKSTGAFYSGQNARNLLGLPHVGEVKIVPGNHGKYNIFIQSTSVNRKLPSGTKVLYWEKVGVPYQEGVSAPWGP